MSLTGKTIGQLPQYTQDVTGSILFPIEYNGSSYSIAQDKLTSSISASYASTASFAISASSSTSASYSTTASFATSASYSTTASYLLGYISPFPFTGSAQITGSLGVTGSINSTGNITTVGTLTAQTLVVQTITSSITYSSGSNIFGSRITDRQTMTGSVNITGSLTVIGKGTITDLTGSLFGTSSYASTASFATSASYSTTASFATSASYSATASYLLGYNPGFPFTGSAQITGSLFVSGSTSLSGSLGHGLSQIQNPNASYDTGFITGSILSNISGSAANWNGSSFYTGFSVLVSGSTTPISSSAIATVGKTYYYAVSGSAYSGNVTVTFGGVNPSNGSFSTVPFFGYPGTAYSYKALTTTGIVMTPSSNFSGSMAVIISETTGSSPIMAFSSSAGAGGLEIRNVGNNVILGQNAGARANSTMGTVIIGANAAPSANSSTSLVVIGSGAGASIVGEASNTVLIGTNAGANLSGTYPSNFSNTMVGSGAGQNNAGSYRNTIIGTGAAQSTTTGTQNTAVGASAMGFNTSGGGNAVLGVFAGYTTSASVNVTAIDNSVMLGISTKPLGNSQTNQIVIGASAIGNGSNTSVIGNTSTTQTQLFGNTILSNALQPADNGARLQVNASGSQTALFVSGSSSFTGSVNVSGSITTLGTLTAQTLVVQTITSSITYSSGSNVFGNSISNTQVFTGSTSISGSLNASGVITFSNLGTGTVSATSGLLSTTSDMTLKIEDGYINNALEKVLKLTPRYFHWKEESGLPTDIRQLGFYAQEVNSALGEEAANTPRNETDKWGIYDRGIIAFLTKAIQEQNQTIASLQDRITELENKLT